MPAPPLIPLDADEALVASKLEGIRNLSTERILKSLEVLPKAAMPDLG